MAVFVARIASPVPISVSIRRTSCRLVISELNQQKTDVHTHRVCRPRLQTINALESTTEVKAQHKQTVPNALITSHCPNNPPQRSCTITSRRTTSGT